VRARLEPSTWLLAGVAAWALLCAGIALMHFGSGYKLLPMPAEAAVAGSDPSAAKKPVHPAMGPLEDYAEAYTHPLFYLDRKPIAVHVGPGTDAAAAQQLDVTLTSVIMSPGLQMALVQDPKTKEVYRVREGQSLGGTYSGWKLTGLSPRSATFAGGGQGESTLELRVFDGKGGEEPTRMGLTPQAVAAGAAGTPHPGHPVPDIEVQQPPPPETTPDPSQPDPAANEAAARAAAEAANQAEQIRRRIEERRKQAQAQRAANNKER